MFKRGVMRLGCVESQRVYSPLLAAFFGFGDLRELRCEATNTPPLGAGKLFLTWCWRLIVFGRLLRASPRCAGTGCCATRRAAAKGRASPPFGRPPLTRARRDSPRLMARVSPDCDARRLAGVPANAATKAKTGCGWHLHPLRIADRPLRPVELPDWFRPEVAPSQGAVPVPLPPQMKHCCVSADTCSGHWVVDLFTCANDLVGT